MAVNRTIETRKELTPQTIDRGKTTVAGFNTAWYEQGDDGPELYESVFSLVNKLKEEQEHRFDRIKRYMRLYGGRNFTSLTAKSYQKEQLGDYTAVSFNGIQSVVDTVMSKIASNKPVPTFLTEDGNFDERLRAKKLSKYVQGIFSDQKVYEKSRYVSKSAFLLGDGAFYPYQDGDTVKIEWVFPNEIIVDDVEAFYGRPGNFYREKHIPRTKLLGMFPKHDVKILAVNTVADTGGSDLTIDHVRVIEAWHLASDKDKKDGRHAIAIENETLLDEVYEKTYDPFVWLRWSEPLVGWWGRGLAEELQGLQIEVNRLLKKIQKSFHLAAVPWVLLPKGANVSTADIRNEIGLILRYAGNVPPKIQTHQTVNSEVFQHLDRLIRLMFEKAGISQLSASAVKPPGIESGIALREFHSIETERLILAGQAHEQMHLELARRIVDISRDIAKDDKKKSPTTRVPGQRSFETISWKDVDLADERYVMQVFPVSSLPSSPAGRKQEVIELMEAGFLELPEAMALLDFPDLSAEKNIRLAALKNIDWVISEMLEKGVYHAPQPFQDLQLGLQRVNSAYLMAFTDHAPEERLDILRRWLENAEEMLTMGALPPEGAPPPPPVPGAPPVEAALPPTVAA